MINKIFKISKNIRYVAIYKNGRLKSKSRNAKNQSDTISDKYEELFINPIILKATSQRGNIDCGGLDYLVVKYGNFFQFILPMKWGHISVCIEKNTNPIKIIKQIMKQYANKKYNKA